MSSAPSTPLRSHGRYGYSALPHRPVYDWPGGARLAVYVAVNLEHFAFGEGAGAELAPAGGQPDVLNYAWRDWGNRVGAWRLLDTLDRLRLPAAALVNTALYDHCPALVAAHRGRGDEVVAHGRTNSEKQGAMAEAAEAALIRATTERLIAEEGRAPRGWLGPHISESERTPDLLAEAGYHYLLDWCMDDQPVWMRKRPGADGAAGRILSVPYPQELNDIPAIVARKDGPAQFAEAIVTAFHELREQAAAAPLVMGLALHPYIIAQPHRLRPLREALAVLAEPRREVWLTTPGQIAAHVASLPAGTLPGG